MVTQEGASPYAKQQVLCVIAALKVSVVVVLASYIERAMKTFGPVLITLLAGLCLALASPQGGRDGDPCNYSCTEGGGCEVHYTGPPR